MSDEQRAAWLAFWPRAGTRLATPGETTDRGTIPDTRGMWAVYRDIGGTHDSGWMRNDVSRVANQFFLHIVMPDDRNVRVSFLS